jgi:hypothetical protein
MLCLRSLRRSLRVERGLAKDGLKVCDEGIYTLVWSSLPVIYVWECDTNI